MQPLGANQLQSGAAHAGLIQRRTKPGNGPRSPADLTDLIPGVGFACRDERDLFGSMSQPLDDHLRLDIAEAASHAFLAQDVTH